jgi:hypothetical protein
MSLILDDSQLERLAELASRKAERLDHEAQAHERRRHGHPESLRDRAAHARITLARCSTTSTHGPPPERPSQIQGQARDDTDAQQDPPRADRGHCRHRVLRREPASPPPAAPGGSHIIARRPVLRDRGERQHPRRGRPQRRDLGQLTEPRRHPLEACEQQDQQQRRPAAAHHGGQLASDLALAALDADRMVLDLRLGMNGDLGKQSGKLLAAEQKITSDCQ